MRRGTVMPDSCLRIGLLLMIIKVVGSFSIIVEITDTQDTILSVAAAAFLMISLMEKELPPRLLAVFGGFLLLGAVTSSRVNNVMIFIPLLSCMAMYDEDLDEIIEYLLFWQGLILAVQMAASVVLHLMGRSMLTEVGHDMCFNFGSSHPNVFACMAVNVLAMYLWVYFEYIGIRQMAVIGLISGVLYYMTGSRTGLAVALFLVAATCLCKNRDREYGLVRVMAALAVPALSVLFFVLCEVFPAGYSPVMLLDKVLSMRVRLGAYHYQKYGISLFGQNLSGVEAEWDEFWRLGGTLTFDNIYNYLMVSMLVWLLVLAVLFFATARKGDVRCSVFILGWALYGVAEIHVLNPFMYFGILLISDLFNPRAQWREVGRYRR